ncbi:MAG: CBS domain-containing protein [Candidatus Thermoplasmatota archaeon]
MKVKEIMTQDPIVAHVPGSRREALRLLITHNKTGLPVVNKKDGTYVGIVTRQMINAKPGEDQTALLLSKDYPVLSPGASLERAASLMIERGVHHLAVLEKGHLVGILTPADFLQAIEEMSLKTPVEEYAGTPCVPVYEGTPLPAVAAILNIAGVSALPVIDASGHLSGIVTDRDIFNLTFINGKVQMAELGLGEEENPWTWEGIRNVLRLYYEVKHIELPKVPVKKVMTRHPVTAFRRTPVSKVARTMRINDFGQIPLLDTKDRLIAMVYQMDILKALEK